MAGYTAKPAVDEDLIRSADWIERDDPDAAVRFLDTAFKSFEFLARVPEAGIKARFKHERLKDVRFWVMPPPFNKWLIFYRLESGGVCILRVLYGAQNWREEPESFV